MKEFSISLNTLGEKIEIKEREKMLLEMLHVLEKYIPSTGRSPEVSFNEKPLLLVSQTPVFQSFEAQMIKHGYCVLFNREIDDIPVPFVRVADSERLSVMRGLSMVIHWEVCAKDDRFVEIRPLCKADSSKSVSVNL